jgi:hypothetical protein
MSAETALPAPEAAKPKKSVEDIGKQVAKISGKLINRAAAAGAGHFDNPIEWVRDGNGGGISIDTGKVDSTGRKIKQTATFRYGQTADSGRIFTLTEGVGTIDGNTYVSADEKPGKVMAAKTTQSVLTDKMGLQQPDGSNPGGFSKEEFISTTANQLFEMKQAVGKSEVAAGRLKGSAPEVPVAPPPAAV